MSGHRRCCCGTVGGPCCDGSRLCAPPAPVAPGTSNVQTVRFHEVHARTNAAGQPLPTITKDHVAQVDIGCGAFKWAPALNLAFDRADVMADLPSSPGLKRWVQVRIADSGVIENPVFVYWRPEATWWSYGALNQGNPTVGGQTASATITPCGRAATFTRDTVFFLETSHTVIDVTLEGSLVPCTAGTALGSGGCCGGKGKATT